MKKTNRIKTPLTAALTRDEVDSLLSDLQLTAAREQKLLAEKAQKLNTIEQHYAPALSLIEADKKAKTLQIQQWAEANPAEFEKKKSIDTPFARFGFRTGTPKLALLNRKWTWTSVLEKLIACTSAYIRNKPEIDKEAILADYAAGAFCSNTLSVLGMKVTQDETFFIEPKLDQPEPRTTNTTPAQEAA